MNAKSTVVLHVEERVKMLKGSDGPILPNVEVHVVLAVCWWILHVQSECHM